MLRLKMICSAYFKRKNVVCVTRLSYFKTAFSSGISNKLLHTKATFYGGGKNPRICVDKLNWLLTVLCCQT